ncbi:hypothetical protein PRUPE_6G259500 [Prunus persica]|uniref:Legume lectin domain-containing protein n=1 Tax=Prunus persica TaxID=3760 RepID=M5W3D6_PRUPE|nr:hypothetical protein PRUPE_6G259500 [Prunus persica]
MFSKLVIFILVSLAAAEDLSFIYNGFRSDNLSLDGIAGVTPNETFKNSSNGTVFSFSTTFVFAIRSEYADLSAHGMAFVVAPTRGLPGALPRQYLGLFNETNNGNATNHVFALEINTNHVFATKMNGKAQELSQLPKLPRIGADKIY